MNALIAAFVLPLLLGRFFSFLAFAIVWLVGMIVYAVWLLPGDLSTSQSILMVIAAGVLAQAGYFVNIFIRSMLGDGGRGR
ncbi:hypothetical protein GCM10007874_29430 [Labrys miyagiensis]|uniref:Uncharacterized protein n=1 Tax=Labrys miyagiensis TaxID=346912 RepID=A0ABQ6CNX3_9HYPH|nr:hypothetical protein [Labrys miyagiensis]GLS19926.1 hypothetical protein GCM10007874_29430 [Labrys miyagiensis]